MSKKKSKKNGRKPAQEDPVTVPDVSDIADSEPRYSVDGVHQILASRKLPSHPETIKRWIADGKLKAYKHGYHWRIKQSALDEFIKRQENPDYEAESKDEQGRGEEENYAMWLAAPTSLGLGDLCLYMGHLSRLLARLVDAPPLKLKIRDERYAFDETSATARVTAMRAELNRRSPPRRGHAS